MKSVKEIMKMHTVNGQLVRSPEFYAELAEFYAELDAATEEAEAFTKLKRRTRDALNKTQNWETIRDVARRLGVIS